MEDEQQIVQLPGTHTGVTATAPEQAVPMQNHGAAWLREGWRVLTFRVPRLVGLEARPWVVAWLVLECYLIACVVQRALMSGSPAFNAGGILLGWVGTAVTVWLCWVVARSAGTMVVTTDKLFAVSAGATLACSLVTGGLLLALRYVAGPSDDWPSALLWTAWLVPLSWAGLAQIRLMWRQAGSAAARAGALLLVPATLAVSGWFAPVMFWWPDAPAERKDGYGGLPLTDAVVHAQPALLSQALAAWQPPRAGRVNVYALTYAPYASEDVFMRESAVVSSTMRERFGAQAVELVVNPATVKTLPWATPLNLRKAIQRAGAVMDRDHDVLFLHLTSHGGADGKLAADTWPLQTEPVTPELLKQWLDEAGVRWRVISVSACYSGSWIAPLAGDGTLVMTAADADHTSYGCGRRSELTFFGRAMYEEALRKTWSFTEAHAHARKVIEVREQEAGKTDGYSNPQISEGAGVRSVLRRLEAQFSAR